MSIPAPRRPAGNATPEPTRRQLDELDALLQRMLALPVDPLEEASPAPLSDSQEMAVALAEPPAFAPPPVTSELGSGTRERSGVPRSEPPLPSLEELVSPLPRRQRPALWLRPLVWGNRAFDRCAGSLGPPGRWVSGQTGRTVLGLLGLLCLAAATALVAMDWTGWIW